MRAQEAFHNTFSFIKHRISTSRPDALSRMTGPTARAHLAALFGQHGEGFTSDITTGTVGSFSNGGDASERCWGKLCAQSGHVYFYGNAYRCERVRAAVLSFEEKVLSYECVDVKFESVYDIPVDVLKAAVDVTSVTAAVNERSLLNKVFYLSGTQSQVDDFVALMSGTAENYVDQPPSNILNVVAPDSCIVCGDTITRFNVGIAPIKCNHVVCVDCLSAAVANIKRDGCHCGVCKKPYQLRDVPWAALSKDDIHAMLTKSRDDFLAAQKEVKYVKCPATKCSEVQLATNLIDNSTSNKIFICAPLNKNVGSITYMSDLCFNPKANAFVVISHIGFL